MAHPLQQAATTAMMHDNTTGPHTDIAFPVVKPKTDPVATMKALTFQSGDMKLLVKDVPRPLVTEPRDVIVRVTGSTVCGSDLHLAHNEVQTVEKDDILGHEAIGVVDSVGPDVKTLKVGDRVAISAMISCGECAYCERKEFSCCDRTNPDPTGKQEKMYGHRLAGVFGYSHMLGGYPGCQAEYVRVPIADVNCLKLPDSLGDDQAILLTDIACTAWHANELANVSPGDKVVVWGCGPVGLLCAFWAKFRGASRVISIDENPARLAVARDRVGAEIINRADTDVVKAIQAMMPGGCDKAIDATGFRFPRSILHKAARVLGMESDTPEVINEAITVTRKCGSIALIADYFGLADGFNIGALMEKAINMRGGQVWVQKYWGFISEWMVEGKVDLSWMVTHRMPISEAAAAYEKFDKKEDGVLKILLQGSGVMVGTEKKV